MTTATKAPTIFSNLLVATDFSEASEKALSYAKRIARHEGAHLTLAHVIDPAPRIAIPEGGWVKDTGRAAHLEDQLATLDATLREEGFEASTTCLYGGVTQELCAALKNRKADLLVMGTEAPSGLTRLFSGSTAEALIRHAECPVLTIGPGVHLEASGRWWLKHVTCAGSLDKPAPRMVAFAYRLAQYFRADFTLFHIEDSNKVAWEKQWLDFLIACDKEIPTATERNYVARSEYADGNLAEEILKVAETRGSDLIVLGAKPAPALSTHLSGSVVADVIAQAACPVLTIRA